tara:strand:+ start:1807 stop:2709 length:903 start_codon:yes stop_codon:yes gene_type:complete
MNNFFIYKIVFPKGKHYIGCSENLDERKKTHRKDTRVDKPKKIVHKALKKFNMMDTFQLIVIDTANSKQEMFEKEKFYIQQYNSYYKNKKGYNNTLGGEGNHGYVFTKADRKKMSQRQKEYYQNNPEAGKVRGEKMKEHYKNNPEQRQKARERAIRQFSNPEQIEKARERAIQHYQNNPEAGKVHGEKMKALYENNPEAGKVHGEKMKEHYKNNPEARKKQSQRAIRQFSNPEARKSEKRRKLFKVFRKHNMEFIKEFEFQFEAIEYIKKEFNINVLSSKISAVLRNREKSAKGFVFEYV